MQYTLTKYTLYIYLLRPYKWAHLENVGDVYTPRTGHAVVNEDGVFYLFGGTDGAARQSDVHACAVGPRADI